jgi:hypothetical protein
LYSVLRQIIAKLTAWKDLPLLLKWKYVEFRCLYRVWFGFRQLLCSKRFHVSNEQASQMGTALFWAVKQRVVIIPYRRFGTTYGSHLQGSSSDCSANKFKIVRFYKRTLFNGIVVNVSHSCNNPQDKNLLINTTTADRILSTCLNWKPLDRF